MEKIIGSLDLTAITANIVITGQQVTLLRQIIPMANHSLGDGFLFKSRKVTCSLRVCLIKAVLAIYEEIRFANTICVLNSRFDLTNVRQSSLKVNSEEQFGQ